MINLGIVGVGKIVQAQHLPSIIKTQLFSIVATASPEGQLHNVPAFTDLATLLEKIPNVQAVALCMPPQYRYAAALAAIDHGCHVLLEKPPGATVSEVHHLQTRAVQRNVCLYTSWHSKHAAGVATAKHLLADAVIKNVTLDWVEDVRHWHPQQDWIWRAGGLGVFDPGINAISILTEIVPDTISVYRSRLFVPSNKQTPIAAELTLRGSTGYTVNTTFDWRVQSSESQRETWTIRFVTDKGTVELVDGGARCLLNGKALDENISRSEHEEYEAIYRQFAQLIATNQSSVDTTPLQLVADSFMLAEVHTVEAFV